MFVDRRVCMILPESLFMRSIWGWGSSDTALFCLLILMHSYRGEGVVVLRLWYVLCFTVTSHAMQLPEVREKGGKENGGRESKVRRKEGEQWEARWRESYWRRESETRERQGYWGGGLGEGWKRGTTGRSRQPGEGWRESVGSLPKWQLDGASLGEARDTGPNLIHSPSAENTLPKVGRGGMKKGGNKILAPGPPFIIVT